MLRGSRSPRPPAAAAAAAFCLSQDNDKPAFDPTTPDTTTTTTIIIGSHYLSTAGQRLPPTFFTRLSCLPALFPLPIGLFSDFSSSSRCLPWPCFPPPGCCHSSVLNSPAAVISSTHSTTFSRVFLHFCFKSYNTLYLSCLLSDQNKYLRDACESE